SDDRGHILGPGTVDREFLGHRGCSFCGTRVPNRWCGCGRRLLQGRDNSVSGDRGGRCDANGKALLVESTTGTPGGRESIPMYSVLVKGLGSTTERIEVLWSCAPTGIGREGAIVAQILFMMTGAEHWTLKDGTQHPTGFWAEEFLAPHEGFCEAGHEVVVATPEGVVPTVDEASLTPDVVGGRENATAMARAVAENPALQAPIRVDEVVLADHVAVFLPGGHGPMEDLAVDPKAGGLLVSALEAGVPLGVVCHAPAALLTCLRDDGSSVFA